MIYNDFNYLVLLVMVSAATIVARLSLQRRKYSGWYETFHDVSKLTALLQNAVLCFISVLFSLLLLAVSPDTRRQDINALGVLLSLYLLVVVCFFCYPQLHKLAHRGRVRLSYDWKVLCSRLSKRYPRPDPPMEDKGTPNEPFKGNAEEPTARDIFLRFLSFFSLTLAVLTVLFLALLLFAHGSDDSQPLLGLLDLLRKRGRQVILIYHLDLLLPFSLLALTSCTGALLAAVGLDYTVKYPYKNREAQHKSKELGELTARIRSR